MRLAALFVAALVPAKLDAGPALRFPDFPALQIICPASQMRAKLLLHFPPGPQAAEQKIKNGAN
jgi:hypothetical protein